MRYLFFLPFLLSSCLLADTCNVKVLIPEIPEEWRIIENEISLEIKYFSDGQQEVITGYSFGDAADIELEKELVPVLVYPVCNSLRLKPAGALFPENFNGEELELSWNNGFASEVIFRLMLKGLDFSNFNTGRFEDVLVVKSDNNPWRISETVLLYSLSAGIFNSNHIFLNKYCSIEISGNFLEGEWMLANPLDTRLISAPDGKLLLNNIYSGRHILFSTDSGVLKYADLYVEEGRWTVFFSNSQGGDSGIM